MKYAVRFAVVVEAKDEESAIDEAKRLISREDFHPDYVGQEVEELG